MQEAFFEVLQLKVLHLARLYTVEMTESSKKEERQQREAGIQSVKGA